MTAPSGAPRLASFSAVDAEPDAATLLAALDEQAAAPAVLRLRAAAVELLAPTRGARLLDVGCGTGQTTRAFADLVGPEGVVVGIEPSATMLAEARRRTIDARLPVEFRCGDVTRLDLADAAFDGTYCERVFQHVGDVTAAMDELVRVTRAGGRIVVLDSDWGMHAIQGADPALTAHVVAAWAASAATGWSGRQLPALFAAAGMPDAIVVADTLTSTESTRPLRPPITTMAATARHAGALTDEEEASWLAQLVEAAGHGRFFWAVTMFAVAGVRPPGPLKRSAPLDRWR